MTPAELRAYRAGQADALRRAAKSIVSAHNRINPGMPMSLASDVKTVVDALNAAKAEIAILRQQVLALQGSQPSADDKAAEAELASVAASIAAEGQEPAAPAPAQPDATATTAVPAGPSLMSQVS